MGVIDLDARVKKLEQDAGGGAVIDQLEAAVTLLEETVNGDGDTDPGLVGNVAALEETVNGDGETDFGLVGDVAALETAAIPTRNALELKTGFTAQTANGGCFYEVIGNIVHVHIAVDGFTADTAATLATIPAAISPNCPIYFKGNTAGYADVTKTANGKLQPSGDIDVYPASGTSLNTDFVYFIPAPTT